MRTSPETALGRLEFAPHVGSAAENEDAGDGEEFAAEQQRALARLDDIAD